MLPCFSNTDALRTSTWSKATPFTVPVHMGEASEKGRGSIAALPCHQSRWRLCCVHMTAPCGPRSPQTDTSALHGDSEFQAPIVAPPSATCGVWGSRTTARCLPSLSPPPMPHSSASKAQCASATLPSAAASARSPVQACAGFSHTPSEPCRPGCGVGERQCMQCASNLQGRCGHCILPATRD